MELRDAYRVLELEPGASEDAVRDARKTLAKVWHPDRHAGDPSLQAKAQTKLAEINAAFEAIRDAKFPAEIPDPAPPKRAPAPPAAPPVAPAPRPPPPAEPPKLELVPRRRVRWSVVLVLAAALGVGAYLAITTLAGSPAPTSAPADARRAEPDAAVVAEADAAIVAEADASTADEPPPDQPAGTFGLGATRAQVRAIQGAPDAIDTVVTEQWSYGFSRVLFDPGTGRVIGWAQRDRRLKVALVARDAAAVRKARAGGGFTRGSTKDEVIAVQGTPTGIDRVIHETWSYGFSTIDFDDAGTVLEWDERDVKLKLR